MFVFLLIAPPRASALPPCPAKPKAAKVAKRLAAKWWRLAVKLFEVGSYADAMNAWKCANTLAPHPLALFNIARAAERAGKPRLALTYFTQYLKARPNAGNRKEVEVAIKRLQAKIAPRPRPRPPVIPPRPVAPRKVPRPRPAVVPRPETPTRPVAAPPPRPQTPAGKKKKTRYMKIFGWASIGLAGAMTVMAAAFGGLALDAKKKVENAENGTSWKDDLLPHYRNYPKYRAATWACAGIGGAALVAGAVMLVISSKSGRKEKATVTPTLLSRGAGVGLTFGF